MGWTGVYGNYRTPREFLESYYAGEIQEGRIIDLEVPDNTFAAGTEQEAYAAWKRDDGTVTAVVFLLDRQDADTGLMGKEYFVKEIGEEEGPHRDNCPQRILDLLSPPLNVYAARWRRRCGDTNNWPDPEEEPSPR